MLLMCLGPVKYDLAKTTSKVLGTILYGSQRVTKTKNNQEQFFQIIFGGKTKNRVGSNAYLN